MIFLSERLEISFIDVKKSNTTFERVILEKLTDLYCIKLRKAIKTCYSMKALTLVIFQIYPLIQTIVLANLTDFRFQIIYK